jgi:DNA-binding response OmpR family regulator
LNFKRRGEPLFLQKNNRLGRSFVRMENREDSVCVLLLGEYDESRLLLQQVFRDAGWRLFEARDWKRGQEHLDHDPVHVVITRSHCRGWDWKKVLRNLTRRAHPPQLIVTSRTADEHLWSEVLNRGGYDLLPEPFHQDEVERVVAAARRHFGPRQARAAGGVRQSVA